MGVGTMDTSDEEDDKEVQQKKSEQDQTLSSGKVELKQTNVEQESKPTISDDWMIDDVGTIESTDDESEMPSKPLSIKQPSYSDIASKEPVIDIKEERRK